MSNNGSSSNNNRELMEFEGSSFNILADIGENLLVILTSLSLILDYFGSNN